MDPVKKLSRSVRGLSVFVTGAASGMGRATAHAFADEGAKVAVTDFKGDGAEAVAREIRERRRHAKAWTLDVSDAEAITRVVGEVANEFGGIDVLINNAGIPAGVPVDHARYDEIWARALSVLLTAHQRTVRASLPSPAQVQEPAHCEYRIHRSAGRDGARYALLRCQGRRRWSDPRTGGRAWTGRNYRQLHLSGTGAYGYDRANPRRGQSRLRQAPHGAAPLWRSRRSGAYDAEPVPARSFVPDGHGHTGAMAG